MTAGRARRSPIVLLVGPDGTGKSTIVDGIAAELPIERAHWRPGVVRPLSNDGAVTEPHAEPPRSWPVGLIKLGLVAADFVVAHLGPWRRPRRTVLLERGWWDQWVDPRRYRLREGHRPVIAAIGRLLPRADVLVLLAGDPAVIAARKQEIPANEVATQLDRWREVASVAARRVVEIDTTTTTPAQAVERALDAATPETGWRAVPMVPHRYRLLVEAGRDSRAAAGVYRPRSRSARWTQPVRALALRFGLGRSASVPSFDRSALRVALPGADPTLAVLEADARHRDDASGRLIIGCSNAGELVAVAKCAPRSDGALAREIHACTAVSSGRSFRMPVVLHATSPDAPVQTLVTRAEQDTGRRLDLDDVAAICLELQDRPEPVVHGDLAPWNLLVPEGGPPVLVDWEGWRTAHEPLADLSHYLVQTGALLGWWSPAEVAELLCADAGPGASVCAAVDGGAPADEARRALDAAGGRGSGDEDRFRSEVVVQIDRRAGSGGASIS
ncbi:MAG: phosphotransferase [Actinomycetota bacterium]